MNLATKNLKKLKQCCYDKKIKRSYFIKCLEDLEGLRRGSPILIQHYEHNFLCEALDLITRLAILYRVDDLQVEYIAKYEGKRTFFTSEPLQEGSLYVSDLRLIRPKLRLQKNLKKRRLTLKEERGSPTRRETYLLRKHLGTLNKRNKEYNEKLVLEIMYSPL